MAKAVWFTGPKVAELRDERVDAPSVGEVQVAARYSLVSPGNEMCAYQTVGEIVAAPAGSFWNVAQQAFRTHPPVGDSHESE